MNPILFEPMFNIDLKDWFWNLRMERGCFERLIHASSAVMDLRGIFLKAGNGPLFTRLIFVGHSMGGGVAQYLAEFFGRTAVVFNSVQPSEKQLRLCAKFRRSFQEWAGESIEPRTIQVIVNGDVINDVYYPSKAREFFGMLLAFWKIETRGIIIRVIAPLGMSCHSMEAVIHGLEEKAKSPASSVAL